jgi:autotransporter-associated beta strand protein
MYMNRTRIIWTVAFLGVLVCIGPLSQAAVLLWDNNAGTAPDGQDGTGTWDVLTTSNWYDSAVPGNVTWDNALNHTAVFGNGGTAGTVTLATGVTAGGLTFDPVASGNYLIAGSTLTLGGAAPTITVNRDATINSAIAGSAGFTKAGAGTLTLGGANTFTGNVKVNGGAIAFTADGQLGSTANDITFDGGRLNYNSGSADWDPASTRSITIGAGGGTIGGSRKVSLNDAGQLAGSGTLTKTDNAILMVTGNNSASFTGNAVVSAGTLEVSGSGLGSGAGQTITINGGELAASNSTLNHRIVIGGGRISSDNGNSTYTGSITAGSANFNVGLRDFWATGTVRNLTFTGPLTGSGRITLDGPTSGTTSGLLTVKDSTGFTGSFTLGNLTALGLRGANRSTSTAGSNGLNAYYYNVGASGVSLTDSRWAVDQLYLTPRVLTRVDTDPNTFNLPVAINTDYPRVPLVGFQVPDNLMMMWKGLININNAGDYTFRVNHDDGASIYIDGVPVVDRSGLTGNPAPDAKVNLAAGAHSIAVKFQQGGGGKYFVVNWSGADTGNTFQILGSTPGTLTTGSLTTPVALNPITLAPNATVGLDIGADSALANLSLSNNTFNLTSPTVSSLHVGGASLTTASTLAPSTGALVFDGAITETVAGSNLTVAGPYLTRFNAANSYTGTTTVTGGRLELNATGGNAVAGNLDLNAANSGGLVANVQLLQSNQIADGKTLTVRNNSVLDLGANNETVDKLVLQNSGQIRGSGTLTVTNLGGSTFAGGTIQANLAGSGGMNVTTTANRVVLLGNNTYTGATNVAANSRLVIGSDNALGAAGGGNGTTIASGGQLQIQGNLTIGESITAGGSGVNAYGATTGALWNVGGMNVVGSPLLLSADTTLHSSSGNLLVAGVGLNGTTNANLTIDGAAGVTLFSTPVLGSTGRIVKNGAGALVFAYTLSGIPSNVDHNAGVLGFDGTQNLGAVTVPSDRAYLFNSDPGAGTTVNAPAGTAVIATYAADQALVSRIAASSAGTLALAVSSSNNLNLTGKGLGLGAFGQVTYSGTLTPDAAGYRFSGVPAGIGDGISPNRLSLTQALSGANPTTVTGGTVDLTRLANTQTGNVTISGGEVEVLNNSNLGDAANGVTLDGGTLALIGTNHDSAKVGALFHHLGNPLGGGARTVTVGAGGGVIDVSSFNNSGNGYALTGANSLTGSGALTKRGFGDLLVLGTSNFSGALIVDAQGGAVQVRSSGEMPNVASIEVRQSAQFSIDNQNGLSSRQFPAATDNNRLNNAAPITLLGGSFNYTAKNTTTAADVVEQVGVITLGEGRDAINVNRSGGAGAELQVANLQRSLNGGGLRIGGSANTWGNTGDNSRLIFQQINGAAPTAGQFLPWATISEDNFVVHGATGVSINNGTNQGTSSSFAPTAGTRYNLNAAGNVTLAAGNQELSALRFGSGNNAQSLLFSTANDTLFIGDGAIISDNNNQTRTIGAAATRGIITAGASGAAAGAKELIVHANQGTVAIESKIVDNNGPVSLIKATGGGTVELRGGTGNTYSGGTYVYSGRVNVTSTGGLGSGPVLVKGAALQLNAAGATSNTSGIVGKDGSEIYLASNVAYNQPGDRYIIEAGTTITGATNVAGNSIAGLTRVSALTGGGQIILQPGAIIRSTNAFNGDVMTNMIANLGTDADLYYNQSGGGGQLQYITVGAGTPWRGISSSVGTGWTQGTIYANSDFWLQGLKRVGGNVALTMGGANSSSALPGSYAIINQAGRAVNAYVTGQVALSEDTPVQMSDDVTFVVTKDGYLQPNYANSFGNAEMFGSRAKLLVQAGGTVDPGNYAPINPYGVAATYGKQYPLPSPVNTDAVFEAGGRFLINDASGIGSTTGGAKWTMKSDSILQLGTANAFYGGYDPANPGVNATGLINPGQLVYEPGAIVRFEADNVYKLSQFVLGESGGQQAVLELYNGNRTLTNQNNPFVVPTVGTPTIAPENITLSAGGMLTNDANDRRLQEGRGHLILNDGAVLAASNQTILYVQEGIHVAAGASLTIGSERWIDGLQKLGAVWFDGPNSNLIHSTATVRVADGAQLGFANNNVWTDTAGIDLPSAVTNFTPAGAWVAQPGNGSTLLLRAAYFTEVMGPLTGNGAVLTDQDGAYVATGWGATSDFTFNGVFSGTGGRQPSLVKVGSTKMTLTNTSTSTGNALINVGALELSGPNGKTAFATVRPNKGGKLVLNNSTSAVDNRLGGKNISGQGGTVELIGGGTAVTETVGVLNTGGSPTGGLTYLNVTPGTANTTFAATTIESYTGGGRQTTWVLRSPTLGNQPGSYDAANVYTNDPANLTNGLIRATNPNLWGASGIAASGMGIAGSAGTPVASSRGDLLGTTSATGEGVGFVTQDVNNQGTVGFRLLTAAEYSPTFVQNMSTNFNVKLSAATTTSGDTRFKTLTMTPASTLNITGTLPLSVNPSRVLLNAPGVFVQPGGTATINGAYLQALGGASLYLHTQGDLNLNATVFSDTGIVKTGSGTLNFGDGAASIWRGTMTIDEGTVNLGPNNSFYVSRGQNSFTPQNLNVNGGTLNLNGNSLAINGLNSSNMLPYGDAAGGTITSTAAATLSVAGGGTFSGAISGAISLDKINNNTLLLTNGNPLTGSLRVQQGTVTLRDEGRLPSVASIDLNYARVDLDNGYLAGVDDRINPTATVNMRGGDIVHRGRAGELTQQHFGTVNVLAGTTLFQTIAGGSGASETSIGNLARSAGTMVSFQQNYGFMGTAGNDTTAIRYFLDKLNGAPVTLTNNIIGGWAIVNNDHFATYSPATGVSYLGNTADGYAAYDSTDLSTAAATANVNDGGNRTIAASKTVNAIRHAPGGGQTITLNSGVTLTINSGGLLTNANQAITYTGGAMTSNSGELNAWIQQNTTTLNSKITGNLALVKGGNGVLKLRGPGNDYTGATYVDAGTNGGSSRSGELQLDVTGADAAAIVAVPGDLHIHNSTVTELQPNQIAATADVYLYGGAVFYLRDAGSISETLHSLSFLNAGGDSVNRPIVSRASQQTTSSLNLTAATAISAVCDNIISVPTISQNVGLVNFTGSAAQAIDISGSSPLGFVFNAGIGTVPTGVAEGGLVKTGSGMLALAGNVVSTFGNPTTLTDVFNVQEGIVRVEGNKLGGNLANTVVQSGAGLLGRTGTINGSIRLKQGSFLGITEGDTTFGTATSTAASLSILDVAGDATIYVADYFMPVTQGYTITLNSKLTGSGDLNLVGPQLTSSPGTLRLANNVTGTAPGANDYSGQVSVNNNVILLASPSGGTKTGSGLGSAVIRLNGGTLALRDNGTGNNGQVTYGNNVTLAAPSYINADRVDANTGNTINLGTLTVAAGAQSLTTGFTTSAITGINNSYQLAFAQIDGAGTLVKGGHQVVNINGYAPGFSGNIVVAGPQGIAIQPSAGLNLNAATNNLNNLTIGGIFSPIGGKTLNVAGVFEVSDNAGSVVNGTGGVSTGSVGGAVSVPNTATVSANILRNNGLLGSTGGNATINATQIQGTGVYQTYNQPLTLSGSLVDGVTPTVLKVAGNNVVTLNPGSGSTSTGGAEIQSGTLRVAPNAASTNPLGTGSIRVLGYGTPTVAAATGGMLEFAGGANAISQGGDILNSGTVRVSSGTTTVGGEIRGTSTVYLPGLLEGLGGAWNGTTAQNNGLFGLKLEPRMGQTNVVTQNALTGWGDNQTWVYSGEFYDADGKFSFLSNIDDNTAIYIDGVRRLQYSGSSLVSTATTAGQRDNTITANANASGGTLDFGNPDTDNDPTTGSAGWHAIEIRFNNGAGGAGTYNAYNNGIHNNFGFGLNQDGTRALDGALYTRPIDPGNGTLFRTPVGGKGNVQVDAAATLNVSRITMTNQLTLGAGAPGGTLNLTTAGASDVDNLAVTGSSGSANLNNTAGGSLTIGNFTAAGGATLNHASPANRLVITGNATGGTINSTGAAGVTFASNAAQTCSTAIAGNGGLTKEGTGTLSLVTPCTYTGPTNITTGTLQIGESGGVFDKVPEAAGYRILYALPIPNYPDFDATVPYSVNHASDGTIPAGSFSRVGYYLELQQGTSPEQWAFVTFDAAPFQTDLTKLGVPTPANGEFYHYDAAGLLPGQVRNMNVYSNVAGIVTGTGIATGNVEFWPSNYGSNNDYGVPNSPSNTTYDFGDGGGGTTGGHGSMQIHNYGAKQTIISLQRFNGGGTSQAGVGIGNQVGGSGNPDWTFIYNTANYSVKNLWVLVGNLSGGAGVLPSLTAVTVNAGATLDLNNHSEIIGSLAGEGDVLLGSGTLATGGDNTSTTFSGVISGSGSLVKQGTGTMTLTGTSTYAGDTIVSAGKLLVDGALPGTGLVTVAVGATLGGGGSIGDNTAGDQVVVSGTLEPGDRVGTLRINGDLTLNTDAMLKADAGATSDLVIVNGTLTMPTQMNIEVNVDQGAPESGDLVLINGYSSHNVVDPTGWNISVSAGWQFARAVYDDASVRLEGLRTPEPMSLALLIPAVVCLFGYRRWRQVRR